MCFFNKCIIMIVYLHSTSYYFFHFYFIAFEGYPISAQRVMWWAKGRSPMLYTFLYSRKVPFYLCVMLVRRRVAAAIRTNLFRLENKSFIIY